MYLKAKNSLHTTRISNFKYLFIVYFKKSDFKIYIFFRKRHLKTFFSDQTERYMVDILRLYI